MVALRHLVAKGHGFANVTEVAITVADPFFFFFFKHVFPKSTLSSTVPEDPPFPWQGQSEPWKGVWAEGGVEDSGQGEGQGVL